MAKVNQASGKRTSRLTDPGHTREGKEMTAFSITFEAELPSGAACLAPAACTTPHGALVRVDSPDGPLRPVVEAHSGQRALVLQTRGPHVALRFHFDSDVRASYPEAMFAPKSSRFTRFADDLVHEVDEIAPEAGTLERVKAIACATAERFTYGHPHARFTDGLDKIPALGCGLVEGSCVDINTYFIASLRAAGIEAGYVTGFYFPAEKRDHCTDGHCWVVTRVGDVVQEWDIAHHLKMGTRQIAPGLNPKPGVRAACFHSMGLDFPDLGLAEIKALIEPLMISDGRVSRFDRPEIRLHHPSMATVTE